MNGIDRSGSTGQGSVSTGSRDEGPGDRGSGTAPRRERRSDRRRARRPGRTATAVGCGGVSAAGIALVGVVLAGFVSAANSCGGMFRAECERSSEALHRAAYAGNRETVRHELTEGADPVGRDANGTTPMSCASEGGRPDIAIELVKAGANGEGLSSEHQTDLFAASAAQDDLDAVTTFLDHGFDVHAAVDDRVLTTAVRANARRVLPELVRRGASADVGLRSAITDAAPAAPFGSLFRARSNVEVAVPSSSPVVTRLALADLFLDLGAQAGDHATMVAAASAGDPGFMTRLLDRGADPNARDGAPLSQAASGGSKEIVRVLLAHGADPNLATTGPSALLWASLWAHDDIVGQLLAAHADPNFGGQVSRVDADLAIDLASRNQPPAATAYVKAAFASFADGGNVAPIVAAGTWDHGDIAAKLLAAGADPNARAGSLTAVESAAAFNHPITLKILLEAGASPTSPDPAVVDPVALATQLGWTEVVALLRAPR